LGIHFLNFNKIIKIPQDKIAKQPLYLTFIDGFVIIQIPLPNFQACFGIAYFKIYLLT